MKQEKIDISAYIKTLNDHQEELKKVNAKIKEISIDASYIEDDIEELKEKLEELEDECGILDDIKYGLTGEIERIKAILKDAKTSIYTHTGLEEVGQLALNYE